MVGAVGGAGGRPSGLLSVAAAPPMTSPVATLANCFVQHPNTHCSPASLRLCCKIFNIKILTPTQSPLPGFTARLYGGFLAPKTKRLGRLCLSKPKSGTCGLRSSTYMLVMTARHHNNGFFFIVLLL